MVIAKAWETASTEVGDTWIQSLREPDVLMYNSSCRKC